METSIDFDSWLATYQPTDIEYYVSYDPMSGSIFKVGNRSALSTDVHTVLIDTEIAEKIIEGSLPIHRCFVNLDTNIVEVAEFKAITKINDILHRVIELEHSTTNKHDLKLTYEKISKTLTINLLTPTYWEDDTQLSFYLTDYNDPNIVYEKIDVMLSNIKVASATYNNIEMPGRFSVYTKRIFRNYVLEIL